MAKGPAPLNPEVVYNAIVRLGGARLDQIHVTLMPTSRSSVSRAIRKLAGKCIMKTGERWTPISAVSVLDPAPQVGQVEVPDSIPVLDPVAEVGQVDPQVGQVGQVEALLLDPVGQVGQVGQNHVDLHGSKNMATGAPANNGEPDGSLLGSENEPLIGADRPDGGSVQQKDPDESVADAAFRAARATASVNGEPSQVEVMKFFLTYVANIKSKHNQREGLKKSRDKEYQINGYTPREKIDAMRDLAIHLMGAVAQNTLIRDLRWISDSMNLLITDWSMPKSMAWARNKMRVAREASMVAAVAPAAAIGARIAEATKETPLVAAEDDEMEPITSPAEMHSTVASDTELTPFNGGPASEAPVYEQTPCEAHEAEMDAAQDALAVEADAHDAKKALEAVAEPAAVTGTIDARIVDMLAGGVCMSFETVRSRLAGVGKDDVRAAVNTLLIAGRVRDICGEFRLARSC